MKPQRIELIQGSESWLSWRRCHLTATDTAKIMGLSKWGTATDVYQDKMGLVPEKPMNAAMKAGVENEPVARKLLSLEYGFDFEPAVYESGEYPFMGASLDAITKYGKKGGEIKCVGQKTYGRAWEGDIDEEYRIQCQKQMFVSDLQEWILFFMLVDKEEHKDKLTYNITIKRDEAFIAKMIKAENDFWFNHIIPQIPPPMTFRDWEVRDNTFENNLALKWVESKEAEDNAIKVRKGFEAQLKELCEGKSVHYKQAGVKVQQISRKGVVDWDKVCLQWEISKEELEKYRKEKSCYVKIRSEV